MKIKMIFYIYKFIKCKQHAIYTFLYAYVISTAQQTNHCTQTISGRFQSSGLFVLVNLSKIYKAMGVVLNAQVIIYTYLMLFYYIIVRPINEDSARLFIMNIINLTFRASRLHECSPTGEIIFIYNLVKSFFFFIRNLK